MAIAAGQMAYPNYVPEVWHVYLVYVAMMFLSYVIICLPTRYVSWFNIWATGLGIVILIVTTITLPIKAQELNSGKEIFTNVRFTILKTAKLARILIEYRVGVQPDWMAGGVVILHDIPFCNVDAQRLRRGCSRV